MLSGTSVLDAGEPNGAIEIIGRLLSPVAAAEVGTIRAERKSNPLLWADRWAEKCSKRNHVKVPDVPLVFNPAPTFIPMHTVKDDSTDYEAELTIVIGRTCKNVSKSETLGYALSYTAANEVSSRVAQLAQS
ncbi:uncharacterized protein F4812DRAFT_458260 [Daldinia caldariorum]|uniref:uncharacterized protein n=1 Tax=Daldinia caldariorum TaxID=326644 RepID=UPI0020077EF0|nr:uncharacterized protein F4812DRAFT_458260 [Daldinia caldariorum]KAI1468732.1 hypothetical protein F4812DRAFT_458260 [Daldinia caldariorum]